MYLFICRRALRIAHARVTSSFSADPFGLRWDTPFGESWRPTIEEIRRIFYSRFMVDSLSFPRFMVDSLFPWWFMGPGL